MSPSMSQSVPSRAPLTARVQDFFPTHFGTRTLSPVTRPGCALVLPHCPPPGPLKQIRLTPEQRLKAKKVTDQILAVGLIKAITAANPAPAFPAVTSGKENSVSIFPRERGVAGPTLSPSPLRRRHPRGWWSPRLRQNGPGNRFRQLPPRA